LNLNRVTLSWTELHSIESGDLICSEQGSDLLTRLLKDLLQCAHELQSDQTNCDDFFYRRVSLLKNRQDRCLLIACQI